MEDDAVRRDGGASSDAPSDHDCEVVHAPGVGTSPAAHEARAPALGHLPGDPFVGAEERRFWEAFHDLLLTLRDTGSRAKGVLHALAPHCLAPFKRITPEVVNGASFSPRARGPRATRRLENRPSSTPEPFRVSRTRIWPEATRADDRD